MVTAVYYDEKLEDVGMEFLRKGEVKKALGETEKLDYLTVGQWLLSHGKGDVLVFLQDVLPYTAFNSSYIDFFSLNNNLGKFLSNGGTVVWVGDVPFFYRLRCEQVNKAEVEEKFKEGLKFVTPKEFFLSKFKIREVEGYGVCFRDIISNWHFDEGHNLRFISLFTKYLGFFDISKVCYLDREVNVEPTLTGELLNYRSRKSFRPVKLSVEYTPLNVTNLLTPSCSGKYTGSWIRKVGKGYFVRLLDYSPSAEEIKDAIKVGERIASVITEPPGEIPQ